MSIEIEMTTANPWETFMRFTYVTMGKKPPEKTLNKKPNEFDWIRYIKTEHSTLRCIHFIIYDRLPKTVVDQLLRATKGHPQPEVESGRPDNTGVPRSTDPFKLKDFAQEHTAESFLELCKQRLCKRTEEPTRKAVQNWIKYMSKSDDKFLNALAILAVPQCVKYCYCPELTCCGFIDTTDWCIKKSMLNEVLNPSPERISVLSVIKSISEGE